MNQIFIKLSFEGKSSAKKTERQKKKSVNNGAAGSIADFETTKRKSETSYAYIFPPLLGDEG
jgi:hypothetical protein